MNKNPIINYYLFISIWDNFPTGWNSFFFFFSFFIEPSWCVVNCGWLLHIFFFLLFQWHNLNMTFSSSLKCIWMKMKKILPELIMWININQNYLYGRSLGLSKKPVQTQNLHHNDIFCCLMPRMESRTSLTFPGMFLYMQWQKKKYIQNSVKQNVSLGLPKPTKTTKVQCYYLSFSFLWLI